MQLTSSKSLGVPVLGFLMVTLVHPAIFCSLQITMQRIAPENDDFASKNGMRSIIQAISRSIPLTIKQSHDRVYVWECYFFVSDRQKFDKTNWHKFEGKGWLCRYLELQNNRTFFNTKSSFSGAILHYLWIVNRKIWRNLALILQFVTAQALPENRSCGQHT